MRYVYTPNLKMYVIEFDDKHTQKIIADNCVLIHGMLRLSMGGTMIEYSISKISEFWQDTTIKYSELSDISELSVKSIKAKEKV